MRISDWSSDVCSSDLFGVTKQVRLERIVRPQLARMQHCFCCPYRLAVHQRQQYCKPYVCCTTSGLYPVTRTRAAPTKARMAEASESAAWHWPARSLSSRVLSRGARYTPRPARALGHFLDQCVLTHHVKPR